MRRVCCGGDSIRLSARTVPSAQSKAAVVAERKAPQVEYDGGYDSETRQTVHLYFPNTEAEFDAPDEQSLGQTGIGTFVILEIEVSTSVSNIYVKATNTGNGLCDLLSGTIYITRKIQANSTLSVSIPSILPGTTREIVLPDNILECDETISGNFSLSMFGGIGNSTALTSFHRRIPESITTLWNKGNSDTLYDCLDYHFFDQGKEVGTENLAIYLLKAINYYREVASDTASLSESDLKTKYKITEGTGIIPSHKYKVQDKSDARYMILTDSVPRKILSFGK